MKDDGPLWRPDAEAAAAAPMMHFAAEASRVAKRPLPTFRALHAWSVEDPAAFLGPRLGLDGGDRRQGRRGRWWTAGGCPARTFSRMRG